MTRHLSLKRPLIVDPVTGQFAMLLASFAIILAVAQRVDGPYVDERTTPVIADAITRRPNGGRAIRMTPPLAKLRDAKWWCAPSTDEAAAAESAKRFRTSTASPDERTGPNP